MHRTAFINLRMLLVAAVLLVPVMLIAAVVVKTNVTGGVRQIDDDTYAVNLKAMSTFPFNQTAGTIEDVPEKWRAFDGKKVLLEGQMWAPGKVDGEVKTFDLVYSITDCCFVGEPQIQHFVKASVPDDVEVDYAGTDLVRATGTLRVDVIRDDDGVTGVYHLDVDDVERL